MSTHERNSGDRRNQSGIQDRNVKEDRNPQDQRGGNFGKQSQHLSNLSGENDLHRNPQNQGNEGTRRSSSNEPTPTRRKDGWGEEE